MALCPAFVVDAGGLTGTALEAGAVGHVVVAELRGFGVVGNQLGVDGVCVFAVCGGGRESVTGVGDGWIVRWFVRARSLFWCLWKGL
jgi:hypothetical protein